MNRRCPDNKLVGLGSLRGWKWIIDTRGYANVVRSPEDLVYGLVYELSPTDEAKLDGVESTYAKYTLDIKLLLGGHEENPTVQSLVYVGEERTEVGEPWKEYIHRMNQGIKDATERGLPRWYTDKYLRRFIPAEEANEAAETFER